MDITNYTNYLTSTNTASTSSAQSAASKDYSNATDEELMDACKQFESYLVEQVMKEVDKTVDITGTEDSDDASMSQLTDYYKETVMEKLSEEISDKGNLGLAQQMYEQMKRNYNLD